MGWLFLSSLLLLSFSQSGLSDHMTAVLFLKLNFVWLISHEVADPVLTVIFSNLNLQ